MSLNSKKDMYQNMVEEGMDHKDTFVEYEKTTNYLLLSSDEKTIKERVIDEKLKVEGDDNGNEETAGENGNKSESDEPPVYFEEALGTCEEVTINYTESSMSVPLSPSMSPTSLNTCSESNQEWTDDTNDKERLSMNLSYEDDKEYYVEELEEAEDIDEDEETIATFVTAAGQQLALYAVEDSEDVFAVAVYDESGEPPTNFQFLMKSDVERLIGEGAVRTVKKPSQIKKELLTMQPPIFSSKQQHSVYTPNNNKFISNTKSHHEKVMERTWKNNAVINQSCQTIQDSNDPPKENYSSPEQSNNVTYLMMNDAAMSVGQSCGSEESLTSENEIIQQSTVQYILLGGDQSDSELTFDEIQATLQSLKFSTNKSIRKKASTLKTTSDQESEIKNKNITSDSTLKSEVQTIAQVIKNSSNILSDNTSTEIPQIETKISENFINVREDNLTMPTQIEICDQTEYKSQDENQSEKSCENMCISSIDLKIKPNESDSKQYSITTLKSCLSDGHTENRPKIKRSRKQKLTSVNRGDSEIIIQPASIDDEEDSNSKKRGRRKKKPVPDPDYNPRPVRSKKSRKSQQNSKVEIIEIDIDEDQNVSQPRKDVIEITIDDGKEKGSSDKENEIIMVGDSDDECQEALPKPIPPAMQCEHCLRNFRQKRALDTHSRVCPKLRNNINKLGIRRFESSSDISDKDNQDEKRVNNKQYTCKVCHEKFDAVVVLARHARTEHQKKYRNKGSNKSRIEVKPVITRTEIPKDSLNIRSEERGVTRVGQKKKNQSLNQTWRSKRLNCDDCGRWFPSTAILAAHCLQHATKKSEKKIRQCHMCKKLIKTRSLFIQHMKTHIRSTRNTKPPSTVLQKKLRQTRPIASKMTTVKKRGRPRKL